MMALWLGASSVGHIPAAALRRGIPRDETVYPRKVGALRALPKKGGISRQPLEREVVSPFSRWSRQRRDAGSRSIVSSRIRDREFLSISDWIDWISY